MSVTIVVSEEDLTPQHADFANLLEESFNKSVLPGAMVVGEIVRVDKDQLVVDIGGKCEGNVPLKEIPGMPNEAMMRETYAPGQVREFLVLRDFDEDLPYVLSLKRVDSYKDWEELKIMQADSKTMDVVVTNVTRGGVLVQLLNLKGFIPASQLRIAKTLDELVGDTIPAKLLEVDRSKHKLILSHRAAVFEHQAAQRASTIAELSEGQVVDGEVVKITHFGAFVDIRGIDGLLPLSEISWRRLRHPSDELSLGQKVTVEVLTIDRQQERVSLSMKRLSTDPWETVHTRIKEGDTVSGLLSKLLNSGFLAELEPGVEAFCSYHWIPREQLTLGETMTFKVVSVVGGERRITLEPIKEQA